MAFCNSCGANLTPGTQFCNKCGAAVLASVPVTSAAAPSTVPVPAPTQGGGGALKVILIVVGVIVVIGILGAATVGIGIWRIARHARETHIRQEGDHVKVDTPFGSVDTSDNSETAAKNIGVDIYPGAKMLKEGAASATIFGIHTSSAKFESDDTVEAVSNFYKAKFPNAMVSTSEENHCTIVSNDHKNMITINIDRSDDKTNIQITSVSGKPGAVPSPPTTPEKND